MKTRILKFCNWEWKKVDPKGHHTRYYPQYFCQGHWMEWDNCFALSEGTPTFFFTREKARNFLRNVREIDVSEADIEVVT